MNIHNIYRPILKYFRTKRMYSFVSKFSVDQSTYILDVGGYEMNWTFTPVRPKLVILNYSFQNVSNSTNISYVIGDGRCLPFQNKAFQVVYSNSTIEHLKTEKDQQSLAKECVRCGQAHYIQSPNKNFFIEPHFLAPFIHWLPKKLQKYIYPLTIRGIIDKKAARELFDEVRLLSQSDMSRLFPNSQIWKEYFGGMVKSFIAVKLPDDNA